MAGNKLSKPTYLLLELDPLARRWLASFVNMVSRGYRGVITGGLTRYIGLKGLILAATPSTADTPRAHITNMAALECLRDIGLEEECIRVAVKGDCMQHTRWCRSMAGEEFARIYSWGNDPSRAVRICMDLSYVVLIITGRLRRCQPLQPCRYSANNP